MNDKPQKIDALIQELKNPDPEVRASAIYNLHGITDKKVVSLLIRYFKDKNAKVRSAAAWYFIDVHDARAVDPLISLLNDEHERVRATAVMALGQVKEQNVVDQILTALDKPENQNWDFKNNARGALRNLGGEKVLQYYLKILNSDKHSWMERWDAIKVLNKFKDSRVAEALAKIIKNENVGEELRKEALFAIAELREVGLDTLLEEASKKDNLMSLYAIQALGSTRSQKAFSPLLNFLRNRNPQVRRAIMDP